MAQSKRTFQTGLMNKDTDDRILPAGQYRDALNVSIDFSEGSDVGALENLKGNELLGIQAGAEADYLNPLINVGVTVVGSCVDEENNKIYYLITGSATDGVLEYCKTTNTISPILLDSDAGVAAVEIPTFTFADAEASATVNAAGNISVTAEHGVITSLTADFDTYVTLATSREISAQVKVPGGYTNTDQLVQGTLTATQPVVSSPNVFLDKVTNITDTSVTFNAHYTSNPNLTAIGFKYLENSGGSVSQDVYSNNFFVTAENIYGDTVTMYDSTLKEVFFEGVPASDFKVLDSSGSEVSSSEYNVATFESGRPSNVTFNSSYNLGSTDRLSIVQTSTQTAITDGHDQASITSTGTDVSVTPISSPFKADITGLTPDTNYVLVAYATNSEGTTYTQIGSFKTNTDSISLPAFTSSNATAGTSLVVFGATPQSNGGDANTSLHVVSNQGGGTTLADYKTAAYSLMTGGSAAGYELHTVGAWSSGVAQSVSVATTGGQIRRGLIFAKNSSTLQDGSDNAGYKFDTSLVSATANAPNVDGAASFSGTIIGPTGSKTAGQSLAWSINGTSTVTTVPVGGHYAMHSDAIKTGGGGTSWYPGGSWATAPNASSVGATSSWNHSETTTAPTTPGTYSWRIRVYYDSNQQSNGQITGSFTIPAAAPTSGTFTLAANLIIGPNVGQTYGGSNGTGLLISGAIPSSISVGSLITITGGGATNVIQVTSLTSGSSSFIGYTLSSGSGGVFYGSGGTVNWSV